VSESDRQHGNGRNNRQLAKASTSTRLFLAKSRADGLSKFSSAADAKMEILILQISTDLKTTRKPKSKRANNNAKK
jgi:hypothetical protein